MGVDEIFRIILLISGVLIFIMSLALTFHPKSLFPNRILAVLIFAWGYAVIIFAIQSKELFVRFPHIFGIGTGLIFLFFPFMYLYIKTYLFKAERQLKRVYIHLAPFLIYFIALSSFYFQSASSKAELLLNGLPMWVKDVFFYTDIGIVSLGILYTILSFRVIYRFEEINKFHLSKKQFIAVSALKKFLIVNAVLWAIGTSGVFIEMLGVKIPFDLFRVYYLGLTVLTLWVSVFTLNNPDMFSSRKKVVGKIAKSISYKKSFNDKVVAIQQSNKPNDEDNRISEIIEFIETKKPFLNSELTLQELAESLGMSKHLVSELLNNKIGLSFSDIINEYRVKEVIDLINQSKHKQHTLVYLGEISGFNSKATFNRIFKKNTGKTPSQYIKELEI